MSAEHVLIFSQVRYEQEEGEITPRASRLKVASKTHNISDYNIEVDILTPSSSPSATIQ